MTAKQHGCTAAVVDSYVIDEYYIDQLRSSGLHTILIEDEVRQNSSVDLLINTSLTEDMRTIQLEMQAEKYLCGLDYVLLRSEFWNCRLSRMQRFQLTPGAGVSVQPA